MQSSQVMPTFDEDVTVDPERKEIYDEDEVLAETAKGHFTSDEALEAPDDPSEIDRMARAAGIPVADQSVVLPSEAVEQRDETRYELDPDSADDREERDANLR